VIEETQGGSPARRIGLRPGDVILRLNDSEVRDVAMLVKLLKASSHGWELTIRRGGEEIETYLRS
jgi:S1-C subfamily serine protease